MNIKKIMSFVMVFVLLSTTVFASQFNFPVSWILDNNGNSIDADNNGYVDYADNIITTIMAGVANDSIRLNNETAQFYLNYDNMNIGNISDIYIESADTWNAKAGVGTCGAGFYVSAVSIFGVTCNEIVMNETLQTITDRGAITTNDITVSDVKVDGLISNNNPKYGIYTNSTDMVYGNIEGLI